MEGNFKLNQALRCYQVRNFCDSKKIYNYERKIKQTTLSLVSAPYVKVYLVKGRKCIAKAKTTISRRTLDPLYQQQLIFNEDYRGCILQVCDQSH